MYKVITKVLLAFLVFSVSAKNLYGQINNFLFVGTYTSNNNNGIFIYDFDTVKYTLNLVDKTENVSNPTYLAISRDNKFLYSVNENSDNQAAVSSFSINNQNGKLSVLNKVSTSGDYPCYVAVNNSRNFVYAANYGGGSLTEIGLNKDGSFNERFKVKKFSGKGLNVNRQKSSHAHMCAFSPDEETVWVSDLGTDKVYIYQFNKQRGVEEYLKSSISCNAGAGPRHFEFHPTKKNWVYILMELSGSIGVYSYNYKWNAEYIQQISNSEEVSDDKGSADIHISPDGKFLYATNRGKTNNIVAYSINQQNGMLTKMSDYLTGQTPRNFLITKDGTFLLVANQNGNSITIFKRDLITGLLNLVNTIENIPNPVCLKMFN